MVAWKATLPTSNNYILLQPGWSKPGCTVQASSPSAEPWVATYKELLGRSVGDWRRPDFQLRKWKDLIEMEWQEDQLPCLFPGCFFLWPDFWWVTDQLPEILVSFSAVWYRLNCLIAKQGDETISRNIFHIFLSSKLGPWLFNHQELRVVEDRLKNWFLSRVNRAAVFQESD